MSVCLCLCVCVCVCSTVTYPLKDWRQAMEAAAQGYRGGKVVMDLQQVCACVCACVSVCACLGPMHVYQHAAKSSFTSAALHTHNTKSKFRFTSHMNSE